MSITACGKTKPTPGLSGSGVQNTKTPQKQEETEKEEQSENPQDEKLKEEQEKIQNATSEHDPDTKSRDVVLYFPDKNMQCLKAEERTFNSDDTAMAWALVSELIRGPRDEELSASIQGDVQIIALDIKDKLCTLDLTEEFITANTGGSAKETMALYSIVNTLCQSKDIDMVKINVEGNTEAEFGEFLLDEPLTAKEDLVRE